MCCVLWAMGCGLSLLALELYGVGEVLGVYWLWGCTEVR